MGWLLKSLPGYLCGTLRRRSSWESFLVLFPAANPCCRQVHSRHCGFRFEVSRRPAPRCSLSRRGKADRAFLRRLIAPSVRKASVPRPATNRQ